MAILKLTKKSKYCKLRCKRYWFNWDKRKIKKLTVIDGSLQSKERDVPEYIQLDNKNKTAKLVRVPKFSEVPYPVIMEPNLVIEYYSR